VAAARWRDFGCRRRTGGCGGERRSGRAVILRESHSPDRRRERLPSAGACHTVSS